MSPSEPVDLIHLGRNHPPMVAEVFDREYALARDEVFAATRPSDIVGHHRWVGTDGDRQAGAVLAARRLGATPDWRRIVVTNGTQSALLMLFAGLVGRGGTLATEALTYPPLMTFAKSFGFRIAGVPIDGEGLIPEAFAELCRTDRPQGLYVVPTHQNPTTSVMPLARRHAIAAIARTHGVAIIEDDIYSLLSPDAPPALAALVPEISWHVLGTAKSIAAGMKVAYVTTPSAQDAESRFWPGVRGTHWMAAPVSAAVMSRLIENGGADRIIAAVADEARARQVFARRRLGNIPVTTAPEALHLWFPLPEGMSRHSLAEAARGQGLVIGTSDEFTTQGEAPQAVRIGIGNPRDRQELGRALDRFAAGYEAARP